MEIVERHARYHNKPVDEVQGMYEKALKSATLTFPTHQEKRELLAEKILVRMLNENSVHFVSPGLCKNCY